MLFFFFNDTATTEIYTLSLHDAPSDLDLRDQARPDRLPYQLPLELRVLLPTARQDVHHPRKRTPDSLLDRQAVDPPRIDRSEEHTSELQSRQYLVCRLLLEKKN